MLTRGFPVEILLFFTFLIWGLYSLIYLSSPRNKVNQWAGICGFLLSIGVLKEYLYYSGFFAGLDVTMFGVGYELNELLNSILTAVLYYIAMPCVMIFSFYFCHLEKKHPGLFRVLAPLVFLPVVLFCIVYPWSHTREIPETNPSAFVVVALYNLLYGVLATVPILITLIKEKDTPFFRQRRLVSLIALLPLWYWLITLFFFHLMGWEELYKTWQWNAVILLCLFVYYVRHLFREGIWGMRLSREYFDWQGEKPEVSDNIRYIVHMMKNELAKITECTRVLREQELPSGQKELEILERSVRHIEEFVRKSRDYSRNIALTPVEVDMEELYRDVAEELCSGWKGEVRIRVSEGGARLTCDRGHMREVVANLAANALDAMGENGVLTFSCTMPRKNIALMCVRDTGPGIRQERIDDIFKPYHTGWSDARHMGLGLSYCQNVIKAHNGYIRVDSSTEENSHGTAFILCIPQEKRKKRGGKHGERDKGTDR